MTWRRPALIIVVVVIPSLISAAVAYRYGSRRGMAPAAAPSSVPSAADSPCVQYTAANSLVGRPACVTGRVLKVFTSKSGNTYFDFCEDYRACPFSSVIFSQDRPKFGDLTTLQGQFVEIRGLVSYYKDRPQIIIRAAEQVKLRE
jgi:hypothetical protein